MKKNPLSKGNLTINSAGIGTVTREMVHARARELALLAGYAPADVRQSDYEQAKRELTGESDMDRQDSVLNSLPESKRWDPVPGSAGHETPGSQSEDMDEDGRSESEQLVEQGVEEADHDLMLQAAKAAKKKDGRDA